MSEDVLFASSLGSANAHIAVIGAGLMGRLTALSLARQGHQVTLLDKDTVSGRQSAAYAAAGLLTPLGEAMHSEENIVAMGFESLTLWPKLLATLDGYSYFQQAGSIVVSHEQDHGDYQRFARTILTNYPQYQCQSLNRAQLQALEPELGRRFNHGLYLPQEGQIGNRKLLIALEQALTELSVRWLELAEVNTIRQQGNYCLLRYKQAEQQHLLECDFVVDCRGCGARNAESAKQAAPLDDLRAVRGELFQLFAPDVQLTRPIRLMHPRYQLYIAPKTKGYFVVGATEIESDDRAPMTVRSSMELLSAAYSVHPGFAEANIRQHVSQLRPAFSDNQPKIMISERMMQINGLYRHGFLLAPVVLKQVQYGLQQMLQNATINSQDSPYGQWLAITANEETRNENIHQWSVN